MKTLPQFLLGVALVATVGGSAALVAGRGAVALPPPLRFDPNPYSFPHELEHGGELIVQANLANDGDEPARIVGVREYCGSVCFSKIGLPVTIPARGRGPVPLLVKARVAGGVVSQEVEFFTDRPDQPVLTLRVRGYIGADESLRMTQAAGTRQ